MEDVNWPFVVKTANFIARCCCFSQILPYEVNSVLKTAKESHLPMRKKFFMCDFSTFQSGIPSVAISRESSRSSLYEGKSSPRAFFRL